MTFLGKRNITEDARKLRVLMSQTALGGSDPYPQYFYLPGRSGGQYAYGGTASGDDITLDSTTNATKGGIFHNPSGGQVCIGTTTSATNLGDPGTSSGKAMLTILGKTTSTQYSNTAIGIKKDGLSHGMTSLAATNDTCFIYNYHSTNGGIGIDGYSAGVVGIGLQSHHTTDDTVKTTSASGAVLVFVSKKLGTSVTTPGTDANLFTVKTGNGAKFFVDQNGDAYTGRRLVGIGDTDNYLEFTADVQTFVVGGETLLTLTEATQDVVKLGDGGDVDINFNDMGLLEGSTGWVRLGDTTAPSADLHIKGTNPRIRVEDTLNSYLQIQDDTAGRGVITKFTASGAGTSLLDLIPTPDDGTSAGRVRLFRTTSTTGQVTLDLHAGDGSGTVDARISARSTNSYLCAGGGGLYIGSTSAPDANYILQLPNSATQKAKANAWDTYSDGRIKTDIRDIPYGLAEILRLHPSTYHQHKADFFEPDGSKPVNEDGTPAKLQLPTLMLSDTWEQKVGFIAQDVAAIIPEATSAPENEDTGLWAMNMDSLIPVLVRAVQELNEKVEGLMG